MFPLKVFWTQSQLAVKEQQFEVQEGMSFAQGYLPASDSRHVTQRSNWSEQQHHDLLHYLHLYSQFEVTSPSCARLGAARHYDARSARS